MPTAREATADPDDRATRTNWTARPRRPRTTGTLVASTAFLALGLALAAPVLGCGDAAEKAADAAAPLEPLTFSADAKDLLFTWIDDAGGTHTEAVLGHVPTEHRELVRVVVADGAKGNTDPIWVADVREPDAAGQFTARSFPRTSWEEEIGRRRKDATPEALAENERRRNRGRDRDRDRPRPPDAAPAPEPTPGSSATAAPSAKEAPFGAVVAIVYGASWCGPCKHAKAHLAKRKVKVDYRDIEADPAARKEMNAKLGPRGRGSIPVIDLAGRVLVGYSPSELDRAIDAAMAKSTVL